LNISVIILVSFLLNIQDMIERIETGCHFLLPLFLVIALWIIGLFFLILLHATAVFLVFCSLIFTVHRDGFLYIALY